MGVKVVIGKECERCLLCGATVCDDGCSSSVCLNARPNARLPLMLAVRSLAVSSSVRRHR